MQRVAAKMAKGVERGRVRVMVRLALADGDEGFIGWSPSRGCPVSRQTGWGEVGRERWMRYNVRGPARG